MSTLDVAGGGARRPLLAVQQNTLGAADAWSHPRVHAEVSSPTHNTEPRAPVSKPTVLAPRTNDKILNEYSVGKQTGRLYYATFRYVLLWSSWQGP